MEDLPKVDDVHKLSIQTPLFKAYNQIQFHWVPEYRKTISETVLLTDECHATLDGPEWMGWLMVDGQRHITTSLWHQQ